MKTLKYGYHLFAWGWKIAPHLFPSILDQISEAGFKGIETHDEDIYPFLNDTKRFIDMLSERQMHLTSIHIFGYFYEHMRPLPHPKYWFDHFRTRIWWEWRMIPKVIKFAASIGCGHFGLIGGNKRREGMRDKDYVRIAKVLNKIGKMSDDFGIRTSYEPYADYIVARMDELDKLCELIDPDLVHLTFDTAQWAAAGGDPVEAIKKYHKRINHVHFTDFSNGNFVQIGTGEIDFPNIAKLLKSLGYQGWITIENYWSWLKSAGITPFESAKKSKEYVDKYLSKLV